MTVVVVGGVGLHVTMMDMEGGVVVTVALIGQTM
jgi:hypothetical protein